MLKFFRLFFVGLTLVLLTACGGGSSSQLDSVNSGTIDPIVNTIEDQENTDSSADSDEQDIDDSLDEGVLEENNTSGNIGNEDCITVSRPIAGQITRMSNTSQSSIDEETITEFSNTTRSSETVMTGALNGTVNSSLTFSITNNYMDATKLEVENSITINGTTVTSDNTIEYSPFDRLAIDVVCKNQAWTSDFSLKTTASGYSSSHEMIVHRTIESINDTKSVAAGTFKTYRMKMVVNGAAVILWTDIETGAIVYLETYDSAGTLVNAKELLSID